MHLTDVWSNSKLWFPSKSHILQVVVGHKLNVTPNREPVGCWLEKATAIINNKLSATYDGARPDNDWCTTHAIL